jgi:hypothetical protein
MDSGNDRMQSGTHRIGGAIEIYDELRHPVPSLFLRPRGGAATVAGFCDSEGNRMVVSSR